MDRKTIYIASAIFAAVGLAPAELFAFEQQSPGSAVPSVEAGPAAKPEANGLQFDAGTRQPGENTPKKKLAVPGVGSISLPKLNFGLDLMYGNTEKDPTNLSITNEPLVGDENLKIMGKVKKRF